MKWILSTYLKKKNPVQQNLELPNFETKKNALPAGMKLQIKGWKGEKTFSENLLRAL